jgi:hypothetical protein
MNVCMYKFMNEIMCEWTYVRMKVCRYDNSDEREYAHTKEWTNVCKYIWKYVWTNICTYESISERMNVRMKVNERM